MKSSPRPELQEPLLAFTERLHARAETIPLTVLASLFGAPDDALEHIATRGDIQFRGEIFSNDGPDLVVSAGRIDLEIPSLMRGQVELVPGGFLLSFPLEEFSLKACMTVAIIRKCFVLKEMRASPDDMVLDFGNMLADRRYTF